MVNADSREILIIFRWERRLVFGQNLLRVKAQVIGVGANETSSKDSARHLGEIFGLHSIEEANTDLGAVGYFLECHTAHLAFAPQIYPKASHPQPRQSPRNLDCPYHIAHMVSVSNPHASARPRQEVNGGAGLNPQRG